MVQRFGRYLDFLSKWQSTAGVVPAIKLLCTRALRLLGWRPKSVTLQPRQTGQGLAVRLGESSDLTVFNQVFVQEEYGAVSDLQDIHTIIDLGANVGYSSAYLLSQFPGARALAVEPDTGNYAQAQQNLAAYGPRAKLMHGAVWSSETKLVVECGGDGLEWGRQVRSNGTGDVDGYTMPRLISHMGGGPIDLLKIDIEGAEAEVFADGASWLGSVRNLCIELHGTECEKKFFAAMSAYDYELSRSGELTICRDIRPAKA